MSTSVVQHGTVSKSISVITDCPEAKNIRLRFNVEIYQPIIAYPTPRFHLNTIEGEAVAERILLHRADGEELVIRRTAVDRPDISAQVEKADSDAPKVKDTTRAETPWGSRADVPPPSAVRGDMWLELAAEASTPAGTYKGIVKVATSHPDVPELHIPYTLRVRPYIESRPNTVRFWTSLSPTSEGRSGIVTLTHLGGQEFKVIGVEVSHPELISAAANSQEASVRQLVRTKLAADLDGKKLGTSVQGWIRIQTDDVRKPLVDVPVIIATSKALSRRPVRPAAE